MSQNICDTAKECIVKNPDCQICRMMEHLHQSWNFLYPEFERQYFKKLLTHLHAPAVIYPPFNIVFSFTKFQPPERIKVIIIGQDPYHNPDQATGLAFSVQKTCKIPKSLNNIYKEIKNNYKDFEIPNHGCLDEWAEQGVLLLNTVLTVEKNSPDSHKKYGWQNFTNRIITHFRDNFRNVVYIAWGKNAQKLIVDVCTSSNLVLKSAHPSPFSARSGFFGCQHFKLANEYLLQHGKDPIDWCIKN